MNLFRRMCNINIFCTTIVIGRTIPITINPNIERSLKYVLLPKPLKINLHKITIIILKYSIETKVQVGLKCLLYSSGFSHLYNLKCLVEVIR